MLKKPLTIKKNWSNFYSKIHTAMVTPITREFLKQAWETQGHSLFAVIHSYVYARWPYLYIGIGNGDHPIARKLAPVRRAWKRMFPSRQKRVIPTPSPTKPTGTVADSYHGKAVPLVEARRLVSIREPIRIPDLEQVIPYVQARAFILQNPEAIALMVCPCRASKSTACQPIEVCMVVGEPFTSFMLTHHPSKARAITQEEAVKILEEEDQRGRVHHAFFQETMLGRFFGICNCCACCCGAMKAHRRGTPMLASSGYLAQIDEQMCNDCGTCQDYCQFQALEMRNATCQVLEERCMGCGVCVSKCPVEAIGLRLEPTKGIPLEVSTLLAQSIQ